MRGDDRSVTGQSLSGQGKPPRARRRLSFFVNLIKSIRKTSACAETTKRRTWRSPHQPENLRVRGDDAVRAALRPRRLGKPPRARRRPVLVKPDQIKGGKTSACAETTYPVHSPVVRRWENLRVRGDDVGRGLVVWDRRGKPPRARRRRVDHEVQRQPPCLLYTSPSPRDS